MCEIVKLYVYTPPSPLWPRVTRWWVEPAYVGWSSSWWLGIGLVVWVEVVNLGEAPSVANFGERWPLAYFCASKPLFWFITWWRFRIWCGGKPICGGAPFYRRFSVKVASSPLCAANSPGLVRVVFLAVSPGGFSSCVARLFFWLWRQVVFWLCRQVVFWLWRQVVFWLCRQVVFWLCRQVCYWLCRQVVSGWFCQGLFSWRSSVCHSPRQGQFKYRASQLARGYRETVYFYSYIDIYGI